MPPDRRALFTLAGKATKMNQGQLGAALGVSRRTAQRYADRGVQPYHVPQLAALVHPHDPVLAGHIAASIGHSLESLGIVKPAPPAPAPVTQPASPPVPPDRVVDAVVCAAAEAMGVVPSAVRPAVRAAFAAAREVGVSMEQVERVLGGAGDGP